jgi:uncharacterized protein (DUF488 family)
MQLEKDNMKGKLFTGRIYDYRKIKIYYPEVLPICVMRWSPKRIDLKKHGILHFLGLAPSVKLLNWYKKKMRKKKMSLRDKEIIWKNFVNDFMEYIEKDSLAQEERFLLRGLLIKGTNIVLLCHEKFNENCHRKILPSLLLTEKELESGIYCGEVSFEETMQTTLDL